MAEKPEPKDEFESEQGELQKKGSGGGVGSRSAANLIFDSDDISEGLAEDRKFVWALARGLEVLRAFSSRPVPLGNSELAEITGLPKATITRLTHTLTKLGYLNFVRRLGKYETAPAILALGYPVVSALRARVLVRDHLIRLSSESDMAFALGGRDRLNMIYIEAAYPPTVTNYRLDVGNRVDIARSAIGRAYLYSLSEVDRDHIYASLARRYGDEWPDLKSRIADSMAEIRERNFCIVDAEWSPDVRAVGVPFKAVDGSEVMALNAAGPRYAHDIRKLEEVVGPRLVHLSRNLSPMLGR